MKMHARLHKRALLPRISSQYRLDSYSIQMKTVLITGANRGIGLHLAKLYLEKGYRVVAACRDPSKMPDIGGGDKFVSIKLDQSSKTDARQVRLSVP